MGQIEWNESMSVHVDLLDTQHRELFQLYNTLHDSLLNDPPEKTIQTKISTLQAMVDYAILHFTTEENYLADHGFPLLEHHRRLHREFSEKIRALQEDLAEDTPVLATSLIKFLRNWIFDHIARDDQEYAKYLNGL